MSARLTLAATTALYLICVVLANWLTSHYGLVGVGFGLMVTAGTFAAGAALLARDYMNRAARKTWSQRTSIGYVLGVITAAGIVSWFLSTPNLAVASTVAFVGAELVDLTIFVPVNGSLGFVPAAVVSNLASAPVDTLLFLAIAGFPITLAVVTGQLIAKLVWATAVPLVLWVAAQSAMSSAQHA